MSKSRERCGQPRESKNNPTIDIQKEIENLKKNLETPISDEALDFLDNQIDILNGTTNLGMKVSMHSELTNYTKRLGAEVDAMIDLMDKIDINTIGEDIKNSKNSSDTSDVSDDIVNLDKLFSELTEEEIMQVKIVYMQKIIDQIARCRSKCEKSKMTITKCN